MNHYRFNDKETAVAAEAWLVEKAAEVGMPFGGTTTRWAIPQAERLHLPPDAGMDELGELTGKWIFPRVPQEVLARMSEELINEFMTRFNPEIQEALQ